MIEKPRGTRDFLPEEMNIRRIVEKKMRDAAERWGYVEIKTPTFEHLELFTLKSGESIIDEIYAFKDKGGRMLALRPEITAPVIRIYINKMQNRQKPLRLYYFDNCFRYERPQKGRFREFWQFGIELIGGRRDLANFEMIALSVDILRSIGLNNFDLHLGDVFLLKRSITRNNNDIDEEKQRKIFRLIDKKDYNTLNAFLDDERIDGEGLFALLDLKDLSTIDDIEKIFGEEEKEEIEDILKILDLLSIYDIHPILDFSIARGLDYYNGIVFEIYSRGLGAQKQICGGGEYELIELFGGKSENTRGFALGFDRIMEVVKEERKNDKRILVVSTEECRRHAISLSKELRKRFIVETDIMGRNLKAQLSYANSVGINFAIIIGRKEVEENRFTLKNLTSGEQFYLTIDRLIEMLDLLLF
ncbi:histidine--tRNA ligase [Candidatus Methanoliparum sp. LAM-1]|uniref:histidine--tRNA ligase n=1 Tax=Candidatus Methanoliparum sp. LAM-1 TaxID=2874846 RepID=UPI001E3E352C|nr:histidine--tRNA ligase [Candidatus Methanoliparum sp. LAM-1]BDC35480.1 histidine--tRNA ligase [Candidatus Methanoliparum sp. LAM-1]